MTCVIKSYYRAMRRVLAGVLCAAILFCSTGMTAFATGLPDEGEGDVVITNVMTGDSEQDTEPVQDDAPNDDGGADWYGDGNLNYGIYEDEGESHGDFDSSEELSETGQLFIHKVSNLREDYEQNAFAMWMDFMWAVQDIYATMDELTVDDYSCPEVMSAMEELQELSSAASVSEFISLARQLFNNVRNNMYLTHYVWDEALQDWSVRQDMDAFNEDYSGCLTVYSFITKKDAAQPAVVEAKELIETAKARINDWVPSDGISEAADRFQQVFSAFVGNCSQYAMVYGDFNQARVACDSILSQGRNLSEAELESVGLFDYEERALNAISPYAYNMYCNYVLAAQGSSSLEDMRNFLDAAEECVPYISDAFKTGYSEMYDEVEALAEGLRAYLESSDKPMSSAERAFLDAFYAWKAGYETEYIQWDRHMGYFQFVYGANIDELTFWNYGLGLLDPDGFEPRIGVFTELMHLFYAARGISTGTPDMDDALDMQSVFDESNVELFVVTPEGWDAAYYLYDALWREAYHQWMVDGTAFLESIDPNDGIDANSDKAVSFLNRYDNTYIGDVAGQISLTQAVFWYYDDSNEDAVERASDLYDEICGIANCEDSGDTPVVPSAETQKWIDFANDLIEKVDGQYFVNRPALFDYEWSKIPVEDLDSEGNPVWLEVSRQLDLRLYQVWNGYAWNIRWNDMPKIAPVAYAYLRDGIGEAAEVEAELRNIVWTQFSAECYACPEFISIMDQLLEQGIDISANGHPMVIAYKDAAESLSAMADGGDFTERPWYYHYMMQHIGGMWWEYDASMAVQYVALNMSGLDEYDAAYNRFVAQFEMKSDGLSSAVGRIFELMLRYDDETITDMDREYMLQEIGDLLVEIDRVGATDMVRSLPEYNITMRIFLDKFPFMEKMRQVMDVISNRQSFSMYDGKPLKQYADISALPVYTGSEVIYQYLIKPEVEAMSSGFGDVLKDVDAICAEYCADEAERDTFLTFVVSAYKYLDKDTFISGNVDYSADLFNSVSELTDLQKSQPEVAELLIALADAGFDANRYDSSPINISLAWTSGSHMQVDDENASWMALDYTNPNTWEDAHSTNYVELMIGFSVQKDIRPGELKLSIPTILSDEPGSASFGRFDGIGYANDEGFYGQAYPFVGVDNVVSTIATMPDFEVVNARTHFADMYHSSSDYAVITNTDSMGTGNYVIPIRYAVHAYDASKLSFFESDSNVLMGRFNSAIGVDFGVFTEDIPFGFELNTAMLTVANRNNEYPSLVTNERGADANTEKHHVYRWTKKIESYYGITKEEFNEAIADYESVFVEFVVDTYAYSSSALRKLGLDIELIGNGEIVGSYLYQTSRENNGLVRNDDGTYTWDWYNRRSSNGSYYDFQYDYYYGLYKSALGYYILQNGSNAYNALHLLVKYDTSDVFDGTGDINAGTGNINVGMKVTAHAEDCHGNEIIGDVLQLNHKSVLGYITTSGSTHSYATLQSDSSRRDIAGFLLANGYETGNDNLIWFEGKHWHASDDYSGDISDLPFYRIETVSDLVLVSGSQSDGYVELGAGDYYFTYLDVGFGDGITSPGSFTGWSEQIPLEELSERGDPNIYVYVMTDDSPDEWVFDGKIPFSKCGYGSTSSEYGWSGIYQFANSNVIRYKVVDPCGYGHTTLYTTSYLVLRGSETVKRLIAEAASLGTELTVRVWGGAVCYDEAGQLDNSYGRNNIVGAGGDLVRDFDVRMYPEIYSHEDNKYMHRDYINPAIIKPQSSYANLSLTAFAYDVADNYFADNVRFGWGTTQEAGWYPSVVGCSVVPTITVPYSSANAGVSLDGYRGVMSVLPDDSIYKTKDIRIRVFVPATLNVDNVISGISRYSADIYDTYPSYSRDRYGLCDSPYDIVDWEVDENYNNTDYHMVTVRLHSDAGPLYANMNIYSSTNMQRTGSMFGGIRVLCSPRADYVKTNEYRFISVAEFLDKDGNVVALSEFNSGSDDTTPDDGSYMPWDQSKFGDLNRNGDTGTLEMVTDQWGLAILGLPGVSNISIVTQGDSAPAWRRTDDLTLGMPYRYRLGYGATSNRSTNAVLFNSIEEGQRLQGVLKSVDTSELDRRGIPYTLFVSEEQINSEAYINEIWTHEKLMASDAWMLAEDVSDYSTIRSIAVSFTDADGTSHIFEGEGDGDGSGYVDNFVYVYLNMELPLSGVDRSVNKITNTAFFTDRLVSDSNSDPRSGPSSTVTLHMSYDAKPVIHKTVGIGSMMVNDRDVTIRWVDPNGNEVSCIVVPESDVSTYKDAYPAAPEGCVWGSPVHMSDTYILIKSKWEGPSMAGISPLSVDPDPDVSIPDDYAEGTGVLSGNRTLTINRSTLQTDSVFRYYYCLSYQATAGVVDGLVIYDNLEDGNPSRFAGRLDSIVVDCQSLDGYRDEPVTGTVYMRRSSVCGPDMALEGTSVAALGGGTANSLCWETLCDFTTGDSGEVVLGDVPDDVTEIAVYFPGVRFDKTDVVKVYLNMVHAGKPDNTGDDRVLINHVSAGYTLIGMDAPTVKVSNEETQVRVDYNDRFYVPITGGMGVSGLYVMAMLFIVPAVFGLVVVKKKKSER